MYFQRHILPPAPSATTFAEQVRVEGLRTPDSTGTAAATEVAMRSELTRRHKQQEAEQVTMYGMLTNLVLGLAQGACGLSAQSTAVLADAAHSLSDMLSDVITLASVRISGQPADDCHHYGHGKYESLGSMFVSSMLLATGAGMGIHSFQQVLHTVDGCAPPGSMALVAVIASLLAKEGLYQMTKRVALKNQR
jgi:cation diffusion facilitator family transporter